MKLKQLAKDKGRIKVLDIRIEEVNSPSGIQAPFRKAVVKFSIGGEIREFTKPVFQKRLAEIIPVVQQELGAWLAFEAFKEYNTLKEIG